MRWHRARHPDQQAARIAAIPHAAVILLDEQDVSDIAMGEIAARGGVGTTRLYHDCTTKEAVCLALYQHELGVWLVDLETRLGSCGTLRPRVSPRP
jgi:AcrR family transcriptional regulator